MAYFKDLNDGPLLIKKLHSVFTRISGRLNHNHRTFAEIMSRSYDLTPNSKLQSGSVKPSTPIAQGIPTRLLIKINKPNLSKLLTPNLRAENVTHVDAPPTSNNTTAYYSGAKNFFYSKRRVDIIRENERKGDLYIPNLSRFNRKIAIEAIIVKPANHTLKRDLDMKATESMASTIRQKSIEIRKKKQLGCLVMKRLDLSNFNRTFAN